MELADFLRIMVLGLTGVILLLSVVTLRRYAKAERVAPRNHPGLLHLHVVAISISYVLLLVYGVIDIYSRFGQPLTWRLGFISTSSVLATYALTQVLRFERHRVDFATGKVKLAGRREEV